MARLTTPGATWIVILASMLLPTGCTVFRSGAPQEELTPTPIATPIVPIKPIYQVQRGEVVKNTRFTGRIAPLLEQEIFFRAGGRVRRVFVQRQDFVKAGDVLAELEMGDLETQLAQAQLAMKLAEARLAQAQQDNADALAEAQIVLDKTKLQLAQARTGQGLAALATAQINLARAQTALADAEREYQEALQRPWETDEERESYARQLAEARQNLAIAQVEYDDAAAGESAPNYAALILAKEVALAELQVEKLTRGVDPLLSLEVEAARLHLQLIQQQVGDARVVAPFDGQVLSLGLVEGRAVDAFTPVIVVADPHELEVSADLTSTQLEGLAEGMPVVVELVGRPGLELPGSLRRLPYPYGSGGRSAGVAEEDTSTRVVLEATAAEAGYELGDLVRVTVRVERKEGVLWLPPQAVRTFEGRRFVVVQDGAGQRRVDIRVGVQGEERVEILDGLAEGQEVISP